MMESIKEDVYNNVRNNVYLQDRISWFNANSNLGNPFDLSSTPTPTPPVKPKTENVSDKSEMLNTLSNALAYISSTKVSPQRSDCIAMAGNIEIAFDNNAIVRIVSQDGNLVLHKRKHIYRLGTNSNKLFVGECNGCGCTWRQTKLALYQFVKYIKRDKYEKKVY